MLSEEGWSWQDGRAQKRSDSFIIIISSCSGWSFPLAGVTTTVVVLLLLVLAAAGLLMAELYSVLTD